VNIKSGHAEAPYGAFSPPSLSGGGQLLWELFFHARNDLERTSNSIEVFNSLINCRRSERGVFRSERRVCVLPMTAFMACSFLCRRLRKNVCKKGLIQTSAFFGSKLSTYISLWQLLFRTSSFWEAFIIGLLLAMAALTKSSAVLCFFSIWSFVVPSSHCRPYGTRRTLYPMSLPLQSLKRQLPMRGPA